MAATAEVHITAKDHTSQAFAAVRKNIEGVTHHLRSLKGELLALAGVAGFGALMESAIETGATVEKLSKKLGASTEALSQFKFVAETAHVSFDSLTRSWQFLEKNVAAASQGLGPAQQAFQALGLSAQQLKQLKVEDQFTVLADAFTQVHNAADKTRLAMAIFGKAGAEMIPVMAGGSAAIRAAREEADRLGLTLNEAAAHHLSEAHEALIRLKSAFAGLANTLAIQLGPAISGFAEGFSRLLPQAVQRTVITFLRFKEVVALALSSMMAGFEHLYSVIGQLPGTLGKPFREASLAAKALREDLFNAVGTYEKALKALHDSHSAGEQAFSGMAFADFYDPVLQAMASVDKKQAALQQRALKAQEKAAQKALKAQERLAEAHVQKLTELFSSGLFQFMDSGFKGMVASFKNSLQQMVAEAAATELTHTLLKSLPSFSKEHGFLSDLVSGVSHFAGGLFGGFRAGGGEVLAGKGYIVGERGPEYFVPRQHGQIIPHTVLTKANTPPLSIVMHIHTPDAGSFRRSTGQISASIGVALQQAVRRNT